MAALAGLPDHPTPASCAERGGTRAQTNENISPGVVMNIAKELRKLSTAPPEGIKVLMNEEDVTDITADIQGPGGAHAPCPASRDRVCGVRVVCVSARAVCECWL